VIFITLEGVNGVLSIPYYPASLPYFGYYCPAGYVIVWIQKMYTS